MTITAIAVVASNRVIGDGTSQPFSFSEDWKRFKQRTMGHPMIMGRRTYEVIGSLPGRLSIVLTRRPEALDFPLNDEGTPTGYAVDSVAKALEVAHSADPEQVFVIGGGEVYRLFMPHTDELDLTEVRAEAAGSVTFPEVDADEWTEVERIEREEFDFVRYVRANRLVDAPSTARGEVKAPSM